MERFAAVLLAAAAALSAAGRLTHAAPSTAEVFWRAVLPGSAVPDAVLRLLRPDINFVGEAKADDVGLTSKGGTKDEAPFHYNRYKAPGDGEHHHAAATTTTTTVFFHEEAVRVGERLPFHFPAAAPSALGLLPRHVADSIPFTAPALPAILALLGVSPGSAQAVAMEETLRACERPPLAGETTFCAMSLEALVERAVAALGTRDVRAVTSMLPRAGAPLQTYTVRAVRPVDGASFVACHDEAYPYTVVSSYSGGRENSGKEGENSEQEAEIGFPRSALCCPDRRKKNSV